MTKSPEKEYIEKAKNLTYKEVVQVLRRMRGKLSFGLSDSNKVEICPLYDMLPMRYAPLRGGEVPVLEQANRYVPMPGQDAEFNVAKLAAKEFWNVITLDENISSGFRDIAKVWISL